MAYAVTWDAAFEAAPNPDTPNLFPQGDDRIRERKKAFRERMEREHYMLISGTNNYHGVHAYQYVKVTVSTILTVANTMVLVETDASDIIITLPYISAIRRTSPIESGRAIHIYHSALQTKNVLVWPAGGSGNTIEGATSHTLTKGQKGIFYPSTSSTWSVIKDMETPGMIKPFSGELVDIPYGWYLCDGNNGTKDLKGRFIVGYDATDADYDEIGIQTVDLGSKTVILTVSTMPTHSHPYDWSSVGGGNSGGSEKAKGGFGTSQSTGGGGAHNNLPPYYVLAFIQKI